jgi:hypothetical protein
VFKYSPDRAKDVDPELAIFLLPTHAIDVWLTAMSTAIEWNAKSFEVVMAAQKAWLDLAIRRSAAHVGLQRDLGACKSYEDFYTIYADFFHNAVAHYQKQFALGLRPVSEAKSPNTLAKLDGSGQLHGDEDHGNSA